MQRLLIAESSEVFADALTEVFQGAFDVRVCSDGQTALALLLSFQPEALILNFSLPLKDGLTVLQEAAHLPRVILALTLCSNPYIEQTALSLGVGYILRMPTVNAVRVRLMDMLRQESAQPGRPDPQAEIAVHLHALGVPTHLDGFEQLCIGIPLFSRDTSQRLSTELYPAIASAYSAKDYRSIEKNIRDAIKAAWDTRDDTVWAKYFPPDKDGNISCPSNKKFLKCLAEMLNT